MIQAAQQIQDLVQRTHFRCGLKMMTLIALDSYKKFALCFFFNRLLLLTLLNDKDMLSVEDKRYDTIYVCQLS